MDFSKPIFGEFEGTDSEVEEIRRVFNELGISFREQVDDYKFVGDFHIFECTMTEEQLSQANKLTDVLFYQ